MVTPSSVCKDPRDISSSLAGHTLTSSEDSYLNNSYPSVLKTAPRETKARRLRCSYFSSPFS